MASLWWQQKSTFIGTDIIFKMNLFNLYLFSVYYVKWNIQTNHFGYVLQVNTTW